MLRALWVSRPNGRLKRRVTGVEKMFLREFPGKFRSDDFQVKRHLGVLVKTGLYLIEGFTYNNCLTSNSFTTSFTASCWNVVVEMQPKQLHVIIYNLIQNNLSLVNKKRNICVLLQLWRWYFQSNHSSFIGCWQWELIPVYLWSDERRWRSCRAAPERSAAHWALSCHT